MARSQARLAAADISSEEIAASLTSTGGLLHLTERKLTDDPGAHFRALAADPAVLGLA
jgi:hypothetical protein